MSAILLSITLTISVIALVMGQVARRKQAQTRSRNTPHYSSWDRDLDPLTPSDRTVEMDMLSSAPLNSDTTAEAEDLVEVDLGRISHHGPAKTPDRRSQTERESHLMELLEDEDESHLTVESHDAHRTFSMDYANVAGNMEDPLQYNRHVVVVLCLTTSMLIVRALGLGRTFFYIIFLHLHSLHFLEVFFQICSTFTPICSICSIFTPIYNVV